MYFKYKINEHIFVYKRAHIPHYKYCLAVPKYEIQISSDAPQVVTNSFG